VRRVGVLIHLSENQPAGQRYVAAFRQGLKELGRTDGNDVRLDVRWIAGDLERLRSYAAELVALGSDVVRFLHPGCVGPATDEPQPLSARARWSGVPVVGHLSDNVKSNFLKGLSHAGFVEGRNVARLPELAADLVRRRVDVLAASAGNAVALAAPSEDPVG
jgi:putative ABC transport system substrate-binding protein